MPPSLTRQLLPRSLRLFPSLLLFFQIHCSLSIVGAAVKLPWTDLSHDPLSARLTRWTGLHHHAVGLQEEDEKETSAELPPLAHLPLAHRRGRSTGADTDSINGFAIAEGICADVSKALCDVILTTPLGTGPCSEAALELHEHPMAALFMGQFHDSCCVDSCAGACIGRSGETPPLNSDGKRDGRASCTATMQDIANKVTYAPCEFPIRAQEPFMVTALGTAEMPSRPFDSDGEDNYTRNRWDYYIVMTEFGYTKHSLHVNNGSNGFPLQTYASGYHALGHGACWVSDLQTPGFPCFL